MNNKNEICAVCAVKTELGKKCKKCGNDKTYYIIHGITWYFVKKSTGVVL